MTKYYRIHPTIGLARIGDGALENYRIGPESPGAVVHQNGLFRDAHQRIPRQGARFRVYEYDSDQPQTAPREVRIDASVARIEWTAHLVNRKAAATTFDGQSPTGLDPDGRPRNAHIPAPERTARLVIDPGPRTLTGAGKAFFNQGTGKDYPEAWPGKFADGSSITSLGGMACGPTGLLTIIGGEGRAGSVSGAKLTHMANNDGWFDDTADGPVDAQVVFADGRVEPAAGAWVVVAPPRYAPGLRPLVTLQDVLEDSAVRHHGLRPELFDSRHQVFCVGYRPSFLREIYPLLKAATDYGWVNSAAAGRHQWDYLSLAQNPFPANCTYCWPPRDIFNRIRRPQDWDNSDSNRMPFLWGDKGLGSYLTVTPLQYHLLEQWSRGRFLSDWSPSGTAVSGPAVSGTVVSGPVVSGPITAGGLDRAALENCAGGAFHPGIEVSRVIRDPGIFTPADPFRLRRQQPDDHEAFDGVRPGGLTEHLAVPWQVTFYDGGNYWWPTHRPNQVRPGTPGARMMDWARGIHSRQEMVEGWRGLGFVKASTATSQRLFVEDERLLPEEE